MDKTLDVFYNTKIEEHKTDDQQNTQDSGPFNYGACVY